jgi:Protein of unknown function (DUF1036)
MALFFINQFSSPIWIAFLYCNRGCRETPFRKMGWWRVERNQIFNAWNVDLYRVNRYAAFYAESGTASWSGTGNGWYAISSARFNQCYDDNTNCDRQPNFVQLDFNGFSDLYGYLGPRSGQLKIQSWLGARPPK